MLLDIGIPCFNDSKYLKRCLESIDKNFINNYKDIIVWVIDDDSPFGEDYKNLIKNFTNFEIKYVHMEKNSGPGNCRNEVIRRGSADWITWVDDDDIFINNPIIFSQDSDIVRSDVYTQTGKIHVKADSTNNCVFGTLYNRKFLLKNHFIFFPELGIAGTEDSIFLTLTSASQSSTHIIPSFIEHTVRESSQYTLKTENDIDDFSISLLPMCNLCYATRYRGSIKDFQLIWNEIEAQFTYLLDLYINSYAQHSVREYFLLNLHMLLFKTIRGFFPNKEDIKPCIKKGTKLLPQIYYAYNYCYEDDEDTISCHFKFDKHINKDNFLSILTTPCFFTSLHFPSFYQGLIKHPCIGMVKRGRKEKGYPEKYWNF